MKKRTILIVLASILMIGVFTAPQFTQACPPQRLDFYVQDFMTYENMIVTIDMGHVEGYQCTHEIVEGYIGDSPITGYLDSYLTINCNAQKNIMVVHGVSIFYITWNDFEGGFTGIKLMKIDLNADIAAGEYILTGKYIAWGFGDFEGMKLRCSVYGYVQVNFFEGTVVIPN